MLTDKQAAILRFVHGHADQKITFNDLADHFGRPDSVDRIHHLVNNHLLSRQYGFTDTVSLTSKGLAVLDEYESALQKEIQNRADQERRDKEQSAKDNKAKKQQLRHDLLVASIGAAVGSIVTGIIDHFAEICVFIEKLID